MFEFKIAFKYLLFKRRRISASIISLLSILVISLVVWVVLVFLSVTTGIEKNWLKKLTALNAPVRIAPNSEYYSSYYYMIDTFSSKSNYLTKNISDKLKSSSSDPYDPEFDMELPYSFPKPLKENDTLQDPIKKLYSILEDQKNKNSDISYQDYEISAAMMRLTLNRTKKDLFTEFKDEKISFLTQMSYLVSLCEKNPNLTSLILDPSNNDLNHFLHQMDKSFDSTQKDIPSHPKMVDSTIFQGRLKSLFENVLVEQVELEKGYLLNLDLLNLTSPIKALVSFDNRTIVLSENAKAYPNFLFGEIIKEENGIYFKTKEKKHKIPESSYGHLGENIQLKARLDLKTLANASSFNEIKLNIQGKIQNSLIKGKIPLNNVLLSKVKILEKDLKNPFFYKSTNTLPVLDNKKGILLPKNYQKSSVLIGDMGYLSFSSMTMNSNQEIRLPVYVAGFYDPGVLPIGNKCIIVDSVITKTINATINTFSFDGTPTNGVYVWMKDIKKADEFKKKISLQLEKENIANFFDVTTYKDFEFSKDLMQQFQSDRTLFTLIAIIILTAACSNIISMLILLVNDKKKEIAILRSMGASSKSIALIFGFCGFLMGLVSSCIGVLMSILTLKHLDIVIRILSAIQGHNFFNTAFFGDKMPNDLSVDALIFVLIITPILAVIAGIVPAIKASKMRPSSILRSQ